MTGRDYSVAPVQAFWVAASLGKNASTRSSCAVTSIGVPMVDTTEKKLRRSGAEREVHVDDETHHPVATHLR